MSCVTQHNCDESQSSEAAMIQQERIIRNMSSLSFKSGSSHFKTCRFCYEQETEENTEASNPFGIISKEKKQINPLLSPCDCKGSIQYIHKQCLKKWVNKSHQTNIKCSICKSDYTSKRVKRKFVHLVFKLLRLLYKKRDVILRDLSLFTLAFLLLFGTFYYLYKY